MEAAGAPVRILMIEDDLRLGGMLRTYLADAGYEVALAEDGARGLRHLERVAYDLVLLDLMLPDADGLDLCRTIRQMRPALPVIMVTARGDTMDRVVGLELGADDYLPKPYEPRELLARIRAVLRRRGSGLPDAGPLRFGRLEIDRGARQVRLDGEPRSLTARQYDILLALAERAGRVLSREQIVLLTDADTGEAPERAVDVHMARIRAAIEDDPRQPRRIITVRGVGYVFAQSQD